MITLIYRCAHCGLENTQNVEGIDYFSAFNGMYGITPECQSMRLKFGLFPRVEHSCDDKTHGVANLVAIRQQ